MEGDISRQLPTRIFKMTGPGPLVEAFFGIEYEPRQQTLVTTIDGGVASHVGMEFRTITVGGNPLDVACMGLVITHQDYRRLGLASSLLRLAHRRASEAGIEWAALFTGVVDFYQPLGYVVCDNLAVAEPGGMVKALREGVVWPDGVVDLCGVPW